ncbi:MAG: hypothetical protein ACRD5J_07980, partial [Nitrososphaeraceae archaeon]
MVMTSPISAFSPSEISKQLPTISDMIKSQPGQGDMGAAFRERPCFNCKKPFMRGPVGISTCPHCGFPGM